MMTKDELLELLMDCQEEVDEVKAHIVADDALLEYIGDKEITVAYNRVDKWYA